MIANLQQAAASAPTLPERQQVLVDWNNTTADFPADKCFHELFAEQVARTPDATAVFFTHNNQTTTLTYRQLNEQANQLAHHLQNLGVQPETLVGLALDRSPEMIVALLAVWKAGGAFVPLDPTYPKERLAFMLEDTQVPLIISQERFVAGLPSHSAQLICLDMLSLADLPTTEPETAVSPTNLAYLIYTSGSTGQPKGVLIEHRGLTNTSQAQVDAFGLTETDRHLLFFSLNFDGGIADVILALRVGAALYFAPQHEILPGEPLHAFLQKHKITTLILTPSALAQVPHHDLPHLHTVIVAGETCPPQLVARWANNRTFLNLYGATEVSIFSTVAHCVADGQPPSVGRPVTNNTVYILDDNLEPVPVGTTGEIYIGGVGVARGYHNRPELNESRFITNPFAHPSASPFDTGRLYKTGDLGRYRPNGEIEFAERIDNQVKIRGFRVELDGIEAVLGQHPTVRETAVVAHSPNDRVPNDHASTNGHAPMNGQTEKLLVAYVSGETISDTTPLRTYLQDQLPDYMVPSLFVVLDQLPLTPNGKVDRKALPTPDFDTQPDIPYVAPRTAREEQLATLWGQLLDIEPVSVSASFFELGGHSLLAAKLIGDIRDRLGLELPLAQLFETPTIAELAAWLHQDQPQALQFPTVEAATAAQHEPFPLTDVQEAYWMGRREIFELGNVATHIYTELEFDDSLDLDALNRAWQLLIDRHEMLRMVMVAEQQQILAEVPPYEIACADLTAVSPHTRQTSLDATRAEMSHQVLDPYQWPLFDIRASRFEQTIRLHLSFDALIIDAGSMGILLQEWTTLYHDLTAVLPPLTLTFRDYVLTEQQLIDGAIYQRAKQYWLNRLDDLPPAPALPLAQKPSDVQPRFQRRELHIEAAIWQTLKKRAMRLGLTPSGMVLAAFAEVLALWSKNPRFTINLTLFNRLPLHPAVNDIVGDFTSLTLLGVDSQSGSDFAQRAQNIQQQLWQDLDQRYFSGVEVLRELSRRQGNMGEALMPVVFTSALTLNVEDIKLLGSELVYSITQTPQVWLDHIVFEDHDGLLLIWDAVEELFPPGLLDDMFASYGRLIHQLATESDTWTAPQLDLFPPQQLAQRMAYNDTALPLTDDLLHTLFLQQVPQRGEKTAVICGNHHLSYQDLYQQASSLAHWLQQHGAQPNSLVAVVMEKGWEQVVAVMGILMAGAAYLPIDPDLPSERQHYLMAQGPTKLALTQSRLTHLTWPSNVKWLAVDTAALPAAEPVRLQQLPTDLAYVIYTSGSTGLPKGVAIDHRGAVNTILDINRRFGVTDQDCVLALSALNFDLSVYDIFGLLAVGGTIVMPDASGRRDPAHWAELMERHQVTLWDTVPALMQMLVEYQNGRFLNAPLQLVMMSGDWIPVDLPDRIKALWPSATLMSLGGATEASIWSIYYPIETVQPNWSSIPYGKPMTNQSFHVLNAQMQPCPVWVPGDLYIGGIGLAKCYWRDEARTNAQFIIHPHTGQRLYKTGDIGRYRPDSTGTPVIEFLGREDFQVKIRGHRIELGEIEANLLKHPAVREAIVATVGESRSDKQLVAYVVADQNLVPRPAASEQYGVQDGVLQDSVERLEFKLNQVEKRPSSPNHLSLPAPDLDQQAYLARQSYREFLDEPISWQQLGHFLSSLRALSLPNAPFPKYRYPSGGGLYPVQTYLYIKPNRVDSLAGGFYYYHPLEHCLEPLPTETPLSQTLYGAAGETNQQIYSQAAFAIFLIGHMEAITPIYGQQLAWELSLLEAGYMGQLLMTEAPTYDLGLCPIGAVENVDTAYEQLQLNSDQRLLHSFLGGKIAPSQKEQWLQQPAPQQAETTLENSLRDHLSQKVADYMLPVHYIFLDSLPLTANGKVNRKALPAPNISLLPTDGLVLPRTPLEQVLADLWGDILGLEQIGVLDNFFQIGGDSVTAMQVIARIRTSFATTISIRNFFEQSTIAYLAQEIEQQQQAGDDEEEFVF